MTDPPRPCYLSPAPSGEWPGLGANDQEVKGGYSSLADENYGLVVWRCLCPHNPSREHSSESTQQRDHYQPS
jgi:hypothetical protein